MHINQEIKNMVNIKMNITKYEKQNNFRTNYLKLKLKICRKLVVLLSSFDNNAVCDIVVSLHTISYIHVSSD